VLHVRFAWSAVQVSGPLAWRMWTEPLLSSQLARFPSNNSAAPIEQSTLTLGVTDYVCVAM
jgi:hypothetical protein